MVQLEGPNLIIHHKSKKKDMGENVGDPQLASDVEEVYKKRMSPHRDESNSSAYNGARKMIEKRSTAQGSVTKTFNTVFKMSQSGHKQ
jgi:predicted metal-dependent RNase